MLFTIALILVVTFALAALEIWLLWQLDEREDRRRTHPRRASASTPDRIARPYAGAHRRRSPPLKRVA